MFKLISFKYLTIFLILVYSFWLVRLGRVFNSILFFIRLWFVVSSQNMLELFGMVN